MAEHDLTTPETWKSIPGYLGYDASDLGRIRSWWKQTNRIDGSGKMSYIGSEPKILKPRIDKRKGRLRVNLRHESGVIRTVMVHHAVLWAFVGPCPDGMEACHFPDSNPANNRLSNLRWDTHQENVWDIGRVGSKTRRVLLPEEDMEIVRLDSEGASMREIGEKMGIRISSVSRVLIRNGIRKHAPKGKPIDAATAAEVLRLRTEGMTHREIGEILGLPRHAVGRVLASLPADSASKYTGRLT